MVMENKKRLNKAFAELRKLGYFAKQNFLCCQSCAWAGVPEGKDNVVFYHNQDHTQLKETGECYLAHSGNGKQIVEILNKHGIKTEWNGDNGTRIKIDLND